MQRIARLIGLSLALVQVSACGGSDNVIEVTFDEVECTVVSSPKELKTAKEYLFHLENPTDMYMLLDLRKPRSGYTWQDALDIGPPGSDQSKPLWYDEVRSSGVEIEDGIATTIKYVFEEEGEYHLFAVYQVWPPLRAWQCAPFTVVDVSTD